MNPINGPQSTDGALQPTSRAYIIHDPRTGKVLHIHHSVTFPHTKPQKESPEERARRLSGIGASVPSAVLEVDADELSHGMMIKVDVAHQRVVRLSSEAENSGGGAKKSRTSAGKPRLKSGK
jgi:hypothetical protein